MSQYLWQRAIASALGLAIASTSVLSSTITQAQDSTPTPQPTTAAPVNKTKPQPKKAPATGTEEMTPSSSPTKTKPAKKMKTIVDLAAKNKSFKTLVAALKAAELVDTLAEEGPYTVFAPTDAAFAALPKETLKKLLKPENKGKLQEILKYHVISGAVTSKMIKPGQVETLEGSKITLKVKGKRVMVNNAKVINADMKASNGVIHAIDRVLMPPQQ
jgi:uncharacterized surface protein with fasciclin (FAS1) repeats